MKSKNTILVFLLLIIVILAGEYAFGQCTNCQETVSSQDQASSALGKRTSASGFASFASGMSVIAAGDYTSSIGSYSRADGEHAITIGSNLMSNGNRSIAIGHGFGITNAEKLSNPFPNSLMVGFNSIFPTLFVSTSVAKEKTGRVGIGNVPDPLGKLHIRSDPGEKAVVYIEQPYFREAEIILGHEDYGFRSTDGQGLIFRSRTNYIFNDGAVGIGTIHPQHDLHVQGSTYTKQFTLFDGDQYTGNIAGYVLQSDKDGNAHWADPALLADQDWVIKDSSIYRIKGNVGINTSNPTAQLHLADIYPAGGMNLKIGNDAYLSDVDLAHTLGILSQNDPKEGAILLGSEGPLLHGENRSLGVGTTNPESTLELNKNIGNSGNVGLCIANGSMFKWFVGMNNSGKFVSDLLIGNRENLGNGPASFLVVKPDGNVGIGTNDTHSYKLAVNGAILTEEVTVNISENWPDYVFDDNYKMLPLYQLEDYIHHHGHLPDVPDAKEIHENGLKLGEMDRVLLKKIEELTLYIIEQEDRISAMENIIDHMRY
ncbi:MAG TPA: hypothetical protein VK994_00830 [Bacteroidales bacterium]|nr:hypothetical protein [Bacteroidales bacterium]